MRRIFFCLFTLSLVSLPFDTVFASAPTLQNQSPFSIVSTSQKIDGSTGAFTQHIPIDIPPGRNGLQPDLSLDYNSQNTDNDNIVGYGWTLSIPYIERMNKTGSQDLFTASSTFSSSFDGELVGQSTPVTSSQSSATTSLISYWKLDGNSSDSYASNNGSDTSVSYGSTYGHVGQGASFSGSSYINVGSGSALNASKPFTISAWFYNTGIHDNGLAGILGNRQTNVGAGYPGYMLGYTSAHKVYFTMSDSSTQQDFITSSTYSQNAWHHVVVTVDGSNNVTVYVDGSSAATGTYTGTGPSTSFSTYIGGHYQGADLFMWQGYIDEVGIWSRALSSSEVATLYNAGAGLAYPFITTSGGVAVPGQYTARIDDGSNRSYAYSTSTNSWTVYDKKGTKYLFGSSSQSQQSATTSASNVYKWMLEEVRDTNDNYVKYTYQKDGNQIYPYQITYTGHASVDGPMTITFSTTTRTDAHSSYTAGFKVWTNYLISQITAAVNGTNVRQYTLTYTTGNNGVRALLSSVQEAGWSDTASTTLPAMTFGYTSSTTSMLSSGLGQGSGGGAWIVGNVFGDARNETTVFWKDQPTGVNHGEVWPTGTQPGQGGNTVQPIGYWGLSGASSCCDTYQAEEDGVRLVDVNGDGKLDVVRGVYNYTSGTSTAEVDLNTSSSTYGWIGSSFSGTVPAFSREGTGGIDGVSSGVFSDVNGTGLPSYVQRVDGYYATSTYLANGSAWNAATTTIFAIPYTFPVPGANPSQMNLQLIDVNGDHLDDLVYSDDSKTYVLLNTGTGWESSPDPQWTLGTSTVFRSPSPGTTYYDRGMRFADINGDGLVDILHAYNMPSFTSNSYPTPELTTYDEVYLNTGHGWATSTAYVLDYITQGYVFTNAFSGKFYLRQYNNFQGNGQQYQDVLSSVGLPRGGLTHVTYGYTAQTTTNNQMPYSLLVATAIVNNDGRGGNASTTYSYAGGQQYLPSNVFDRKFAGFASTTETHSDKTIVTYYSQGATSTSIGDQADGYAQLNHVFRTDISSPDGTLLEKTFYRWDPYSHGLGTFVALGRKVDQIYASDGTHRDTAVDYAYASSTDDLTQLTEYGEVTGNSDGTFSTSTSIGPSRTTKITYAASTSINLSVPIQKSIFDSTGATSTDTKYLYDSQSFGSVTLGNLTQEQDWATGTRYASTTKAYDSYGLVATSTDANGNATTFSFDGFHMFAATSTDALGHSTTYVYNYSNGDVSQSTDPNGSISKKLYDGIGRTVEVDQSDVSTPSSLVTKSTFTYTDSTTTPSLTHESDYLSSGTTTDAYRYYDGLNRLIQERKSTEAGGTYAVTDVNYDSAGNLFSKSYPYFSSGSGNTASSTTASLYTTYTYDALGRTLTTTNAVGTTSNVYAKWTTTVTDPNGHLKDYVTDAYKNLVNVVEHGSTLATTTYAYDLAGDLTKLTDASGNVRNFTYDGLGRELTSQDLHAATSSSFGVWSYGYDDAGNSISQTDPRDATTTRTYDAMNRMLVESNVGTAQLTNTYDSCSKGIGRLCTASTTAARTQNAYDVLGRIATATTTISGKDYVTFSTYDRQGDLTDIVNPDASEVAFTYGSSGRISKVQQKTFGGSWNNIISSTAYSPASEISSLIFGNGASTTNTYDETALYRLVSKIAALPGGTQIQNSSYSYDPVGNILSKTAIDSGSETYTYTYDNLNRLLSASASTTIVTSTTVVSTSTSVQVLVVGAGGGGGAGGANTGGGGGGGGQVQTGTVQVASGTGYTITIGAKGTGATANSGGNVSGNNDASGGGNSSAFSITAIGGAKGLPGDVNSNGGNGGASGSSNSGGTGGTGNCGANGCGGGGGGGDGAVGSNGNGSNGGGSGGTGTANSLSGASNTYGCGGGGSTAGGGTSTGSGGCSNAGGGGNVHSGTGTGYAATANTGSGGGGSVGNVLAGGDGSAGIVIISAPTGAITSATGGTHTTSGGNDIWTFNSSGTFTVNSVSGTSSTSTVTSATTTQSSFVYNYDKLGNILSAISGLPLIIASSSERAPGLTTSDSFAFNAGDAGANTVLLVAFEGSGGVPSSATFNGQALTIHSWNGQAGYDAIGYLVTPASGTHTFTVNYSNQSYPKYRVFVLNNVDQSSPFDAYGEASSTSATSCSLALTTSRSGELLFGTTLASSSAHPISEGDGQTELWQTQPYGSGTSWWAGATKIGQNAGSQTVSFGYNASGACDVVSAALNPSSPSSAAQYLYGATGNANPDAVTSINYGGVSTSTFGWDAAGNLTSKTTGATSTTYAYDYLNRLIGERTTGDSATTTYGYDAFGGRVFQGNGVSTTTYPNQYESIVSSTVGSTTYATSTEFINMPQKSGQSLPVAEIFQQLVNGAATGTAATYFVHTDNLGSINVMSDASGTLVFDQDYNPYGDTRVSSSSSSYLLSSKGYIGQYYDASGLSYLNARYYDANRGQFLSQDPMFTGNPRNQNLMDPQILNPYSYAENNPIVKSDPSGNCPQCALALIGAGAGIAGQYGIDVFNNYQQNGFAASDFYSGLSSPQTYLLRALQGAVLGATGGAASAEVFGSNLLVQSAVVGGASGVTGAVVNHALGEAITPQSVIWDTALGALTFGLSELAPAVPGRLPKFGTQAYYYGAHTQQDALNLGIGAGSNYLSSVFTQLSTPQRISAAQSYNASLGGGGTSGGGASIPSSNSLWTTPSGAVVTFGGSLIAGPASNSTSQR